MVWFIRFREDHVLVYLLFQQFLNSRHMTEAGPVDLLSEDEEDDADDGGAHYIKLPGVAKGEEGVAP